MPTFATLSTGLPNNAIATACVWSTKVRATEGMVTNVAKVGTILPLAYLPLSVELHFTGMRILDKAVGCMVTDSA